MGDSTPISDSERLATQTRAVALVFDKKRRAFLSPRHELSVRRFIRRLGFDPVLEAMQDAALQVGFPGHNRFRYFCGICWTKIREAED